MPINASYATLSAGLLVWKTFYDRCIQMSNFTDLIHVIAVVFAGCGREAALDSLTSTANSTDGVTIGYPMTGDDEALREGL